MENVAVIIPSYNGVDLLRDLLPSLQSSRGFQRIRAIVVDDGSTDSTSEVLAEEFPWVRVWRNPGPNFGTSKGANVGFAAADKSARYIVLLNNDVVLEPDWLDEALEPFGNPAVGAVQIKLRSYGERDKLDSAGGVVDRLGWPGERGRPGGLPETDHGQYDKDTEVFAPCTAGAVFLRDAVSDVGGWDEEMFFCLNDADIGWRLRLRGWRTLLAARSIAYHKRSVWFQRVWDKQLFDTSRNLLLMLYKNYGFANLLWTFPLMLVLFTGAGVFYMLTGRATRGGQLLRAVRYAIVNLRAWQRKRRYVQDRRKVPDAEIVCHMAPQSLMLARLNFSRLFS